MQQWIAILKASKVATEENAFAANVAEAATTRWGKAARFAGTALKGLGIGAIIALLASFVAAAKTTENGIVKMEAATNSFGSVLGVVFAKLGKFGSGVIDLFTGIGKDISNAVFNIKQDIADLLGGDGEIRKETNNTSKAIDKITSAFDGTGEAIKKVIDTYLVKNAS